MASVKGLTQALIARRTTNPRDAARRFPRGARLAYGLLLVPPIDFRYYAPERIPEAYRQPNSHEGGVSFDHAALVGRRFWRRQQLCHRPSRRGQQNGVRTAIEDFLIEQPDLRFEFVPAFFGLGIVYSREAPWAERIAELLRPFADNILLARMERNRSRLVSRVLEFEHQSDAVRGGYLQGAHMLEVFSAADSTNFERSATRKRLPRGPTVPSSFGTPAPSSLSRSSCSIAIRWNSLSPMPI